MLLMEVQILTYSFTIHFFVITIFGMILGFIYSGERNPVMKITELVVFLSVTLSLFGPAGQTAILVLPFAVSSYYGWMIRGNTENIESLRKRRLFLLAAISFGLILAFATAFFFDV
jgi:hypothetical protein